MGQQATSADDRFRPMRTASGLRLVAAIVFGPFLWLVGLVIVAVVVNKFDAIELGLLIALGSILVTAPILVVVRLGRRREERRYPARG
jgi:multisubunit Na+/H+ antiporter MnhG subunit